MIRRWVCWVVGRPRLVIVTLLAVTVALAWRLPTLNREIDIRKLLPPEHPYVLVHHRIEHEFGGRNLTAIAVIPRTGDAWQPAVLRKVKTITDEAMKLPGVIQQSVVSLSSPNVRAFEDRPGGVAIEYLMRDVPETQNDIDALRAKVDQIKLYRGLLVTPDGRAAMVLCDFWSERTMREIADIVEPFAARFSDDEVAVRYAGAPAVLGEISRELLKMQAWFAISFVAIAVTLYFSFGTLQGALLPMATALLAVAWGVGAMAWSGAPMDAWSGVTPILIMAVAAGHSAQILKRFHEEYERLGDGVAAVVESTSRIGPVMLAAGSTASLGFLSLVLFHVPSLRTFALYTALGIVAAMILELSFIPACRSLMRPPTARKPRESEPSWLDRMLAAIARRTSTRSRGALTIATWVVVCVVAVFGILEIDADSSFKRYMPADSDLRRNVDEVESHFAGTTPLVIEVEAADGALQNPAALRYVADLATELRGDPAVVQVTSVADLLEYANASVGAGPVAPLLPTERQQIAQLLFLTYSPPYERFLDRSYSRAAIWALLRSDRTAIVDTVIQRAKAFVAAHSIPDGVKVEIAGGMGAAAVAINEETTRGKAWNVGLLYLVILTVGSLLLGSPTGGILIVLPLVVALVVDLGLLGASGIELDLTTASILSIGVAIGADYAIYLIYRAREEIGRGVGFEEGLARTLATSGKAVWFVALAIACGYAILTPFQFRPLRLCATLIPVTMIVACASAVTLIPALLAVLRPRFLARGKIADAMSAPELWRLTTAAMVLALVCSSTTVSAANAPRPGDTLSNANAASAEGLLPPEILAFYTRGDWANRIVDWPDGKMRRENEFVEGTRQNAGRFAIDDQGSIVMRGEGKAPARIIGLPFAIDATDASAAVKIIWNYYYGSYNVGNLRAAVDLVWVGRKGVDRAASLATSFLYYDGQKDKYQPSENPQDLLMQFFTTVTSPQDLENTSFLVWRFRDASKRDLDWTYLPAFRRVRQLSPANRSDGFLGSDLTQDDGMFFDGKPEEFTWKLVGDTETYRLVDPGSLAGTDTPQALPGGGWRASFRASPIVGFEDPAWKGAPWAPIGAAIARRKAWVVEATPKDPYYLYGKLEMAIDKETFQGLWSRKFSRSGELLADFLPAGFLNTEVVAADGSKEWIAAPGMAYYVAVNAKMDRATVTGFPLKDRAHAAIEGRVKEDPALFDVQALGKGH